MGAEAKGCKRRTNEVGTNCKHRENPNETRNTFIIQSSLQKVKKKVEKRLKKVLTNGEFFDIINKLLVSAEP